ncbi:MAG: hypothetical protein A2W93_05005 [Bacteroidetes bacterium GWF2_43_63]|nr:MAG: hypothetical protein A2W94_12145 [Bacteroidetes bacterium GWE2_42_42]OFY56238.1 MAG: hypothetical protein A2W93_05005 [Bacteroidetes bacterium GWF2_43_63]HBG71910.1 hypothetical protein [Bacteroidales bacterium]HCB61811.1 hypothetical protein [Bacteroidales bacterium]HCY23833.1 hypothetical protein [Bacteroidales bacterium]
METKKKKSKNLEHYKSLFFETGLVVALFIVLAAFEWKTYPSEDVIQNKTPFDIVDTDPIICIKTKEIPPPPKMATEIKITQEEVLTTPEIFNPEWNEQPQGPVFTPISIPEEQPQIVDTNIIIVPPVMPEFPGGDAALAQFMGENIHYPTQDREIGLQGKVYISFVVEKTGEVTHVKLERGIGGQCDGEAIRVVKSMPPWIPGKNSLGRPVRVKLTLPVHFRLVD